MKHTHSISAFLALACFLLTASVHAQQWDNYRPDVTTVQLDSTNLPIMLIDVDGAMIFKDDYITARMKIIDNGQGNINYLDTVAHPGQHIGYDGFIAIKYRGNSSFGSADKKPYTIRTLAQPLEQGGKKLKVELMGLPSDNNWALQASYADKSFMRDLLSYTLAHRYMEFTPQGRYCEMLLDGIYYGVYILSEKVTKGENRLNLKSPGDSGDKLTGDYLIEVDREDEPGFYSDFRPYSNSGWAISSGKIYFQFDEPDADAITQQQEAYIKQAVHDMENAFRTGQDYASHFDVASMIDYQLATEASHNVDGYRLSAKLYKRRDSVDPRFHIALWDMNLAWGNADYYSGSSTNGWVHEMNNTLVRYRDDKLIPLWWYVVNHDDSYLSALKRRWTQCRDEDYSTEHINEVIDSLALTLTRCGAIDRNYTAWPRLNTYVWPNPYVGGTFANEVAHLKQWINLRMQFMDRQLYAPVAGDVNGDGELSIADLTMLADLVRNQDSNKRSDVNGDHETSIADATALVALLMDQDSDATD